MERPLREASRKRAGNDTRVWLLDHLLALALAFILPGGGTVLAAYLTPADVGGLTTAVYGFLGGLAGLALLMGGTYAAHWFQAPYRQRDEARQRVEYLESESEKPELFDVLPRQSMLGFSIPRLPNGSFHASTAGLGINLPVLIHRGELTKVERLTALPRIWFSQADGQRSETTNAIQVVPARDAPWIDVFMRDFKWDTSDPQLWELTGLPLDMSKDQQLPLPSLMMTVADGNEAGTRFAEGETCKLIVQLAIRTNQGYRRLPEQVIPLDGGDPRRYEWYQKFRQETTDETSQ